MGFDEAAAVLGVGTRASFLEIEDAYRQKMWRIQSSAGRTQSLADWEVQTEATQRLTVARDTLIARIEGKPSPSMATSAPAAPNAPAATGTPAACQVCGSTPAMMLTFQQQIGMLFRRKTMTLKARLCRDCGLTIGRQTQNKTLTTGWWGIISFFKNIGFIASNAGALSTASRLPAPQPPSNPEEFKQRGPLTPGRSVMLRPGVLVSIAAVAFTVFAVASWIPRDTHSSSSWKVNACVEQNPNNPIQVRPISCSKAHVGIVTAVVVDRSQCPSDSSMDVPLEGKDYCISPV